MPGIHQRREASSESVEGESRVTSRILKLRSTRRKGRARGEEGKSPTRVGCSLSKLLGKRQWEKEGLKLVVLTKPTKKRGKPV